MAHKQDIFHNKDTLKTGKHFSVISLRFQAIRGPVFARIKRIVLRETKYMPLHDIGETRNVLHAKHNRLFIGFACSNINYFGQYKRLFFFFITVLRLRITQGRLKMVISLCYVHDDSIWGNGT